MQIVVTRSGMVAEPRGVATERLELVPPDWRWIAPLVTAGEGETLDVIWLTEPEARWPGRHLRLSTTPTLIVVGDDPGDETGAGGPEAWGCAEKLGTWARFALVHGAGGEIDHYATAVEATRQTGRAVLVETTSMHARRWADEIDCRAQLLILPKGGVHPVKTVLH